LGKALARFFCAQGARVAVHYNTSRVAAEELQNELGERCYIYQANLEIQDDIDRLFTEIIRDHQHVDILFNTVGSFIYKPFDEVTVREFDEVIQTNLQATFACSKAVLPGMIARNSGHIINFGCAGADRLPIKELTSPYYIAKTGIIMLTKIMAKTYAPHGLHINAISPGILENSVADVAVIPAGRRATFEDICHAAAYLLSPEADYCNGTNLEISGGWTP